MTTDRSNMVQLYEEKKYVAKIKYIVVLFGSTDIMWQRVTVLGKNNN